MVKKSYIFLLWSVLYCQSNERGDSDFRRATNIDVNKVRTTIFNYGVTGRTMANPGHIPYAVSYTHLRDHETLSYRVCRGLI